MAAALRLYYAPGEANGTTASNVNLFHCGISGGWQQVAGTPVRGTDGTSSYKYVEVANVTTFSPFTLGEGSPTGVEVSSLAARAVPSGVEVDWETASELTITGFDVWRAEGSGGDWVKVNGARIAAEGGSWGNRYAISIPPRCRAVATSTGWRRRDCWAGRNGTDPSMGREDRRCSCRWSGGEGGSLNH
ncbi:MAG: hypothetical protein HYX94_12845 [Chloroflexi bacterium]|nr:hypothetical protein [Chloroflexota bacterium]